MNGFGEIASTPSSGSKSKIFPENGGISPDESPVNWRLSKSSSKKYTVRLIGDETVEFPCIKPVNRIASSVLNFCRNFTLSAKKRYEVLSTNQGKVYIEPTLSASIKALELLGSSPKTKELHTPSSVGSNCSDPDTNLVQSPAQTIEKIQSFIQKLPERNFFSIQQKHLSQEVIVGRIGEKYTVEKVDKTGKGGFATVALTNNFAVRRLRETTRKDLPKKFGEEVEIEREILKILHRDDEIGELQQTYHLERAQVQDYPYPVVVSKRFDQDCFDLETIPNEQIPEMFRSIVEEFITLIKNGIYPTDLKLENISYNQNGEVHLQDLGGSAIAGNRIGSIDLAPNRLFVYTKGISSNFSQEGLDYEIFFEEAIKAKRENRLKSYKTNLGKGVLCILGIALHELWEKRSDKKSRIFSTKKIAFIEDLIANPSSNITKALSRLYENFVNRSR